MKHLFTISSLKAVHAPLPTLTPLILLDMFLALPLPCTVLKYHPSLSHVLDGSRPVPLEQIEDSGGKSMGKVASVQTLRTVLP